MLTKAIRIPVEADIRLLDKLVGARPQTQLKTNLSTEDLNGDEIGID